MVGISTLDQKSHNKRSVVVIKNNDNSCGYRAIFVGKYLADNSRDKGLYNVIKDYKKFQTLGTLKLCKEIGLNINVGLNLDLTINRIQNYLSNYQIVVIDA